MLFSAKKVGTAAYYNALLTECVSVEPPSLMHDERYADSRLPCCRLPGIAKLSLAMEMVPMGLQPTLYLQHGQEELSFPSRQLERASK